MAEFGDACRIWWVTPVSPAWAPPRLIAVLDAQERDRLNKFRRPADASRFLAAHALTRIVLGDLMGRTPESLVFDRTCRCGEQHGKPRLTEAGTPFFSFTHAGRKVGLAVHGGGPIGLDIEEVRRMPDLPGMLRHICSPQELTAGLPPAAFFSLWTRKEALLKATGDGLSMPMANITLGPRGVVNWVGEQAPAGPLWVRELLPEPGYPGALAGFGPIPPPIREMDGSGYLR